MFDPEVWSRVPFHFWSIVFFAFGTIVGSFLNVVIHRLPLEQSVVSPPSHCPHCKYSIPWFLNIPLFTWLYLGGKCANCKAPISIRYFIVEALTGFAFLASWLTVGEAHPTLALAYCLILSGFIASSFIDFEHFIIPDQITIGGMVVGFLLSAVVPSLHGCATAKAALESSFIGLLAGGGIVYAIVRGGKLLFGKQKIQLDEGTRIIFTEETLKLPEEEIPFGDLLYRKTDYIEVQATSVKLGDRTFENTRVRLYQGRLEIGEESFDPEPIKLVEMTASHLILPREAMGFGDVKFMAAIGAFLGWKAVLFSLVASSCIGAIVGITLILLRKHEWSKWIPFGPYIALAAVIWMFFQPEIIRLFNFWISPA